jgi:hypothetical protein
MQNSEIVVYLEFIFLSVDDNGGDLLIHENEDGSEERGDSG